MLSRLSRFLRSPEFRCHPYRAVSRRLRWRLHWKLTPRRAWYYAVPGGLTLRLANSSASCGVYLNDGYSDRGCAQCFLDFLRPGMVAVDCGAHIGEYTLLFASSVGPTGQVHAFEPHAGLFEVLRENVQRNGLRQVVINHAAIGRRSGTVQFHPAKDPTASSILPSNTPGVEVPLISLDDYARQRGLTGLDAIKIDVEGAERDVIEGAEWMLTKIRPRLIYIECDRRENETPIRERLTTYGYTVTQPEFRRLHPHLVARRD
jgi:FkbM family methyltransferase